MAWPFISMHSNSNAWRPRLRNQCLSHWKSTGWCEASWRNASDFLCTLLYATNRVRLLQHQNGIAGLARFCTPFFFWWLESLRFRRTGRRSSMKMLWQCSAFVKLRWWRVYNINRNIVIARAMILSQYENGRLCHAHLQEGDCWFCIHDKATRQVLDCLWFDG